MVARLGPARSSSRRRRRDRSRRHGTRIHDVDTRAARIPLHAGLHLDIRRGGAVDLADARCGLRRCVCGDARGQGAGGAGSIDVPSRIDAGPSSPVPPPHAARRTTPRANPCAIFMRSLRSNCGASSPAEPHAVIVNNSGQIAAHAATPVARPVRSSTSRSSRRASRRPHTGPYRGGRRAQLDRCETFGGCCCDRSNSSRRSTPTRSPTSSAARTRARRSRCWCTGRRRATVADIGRRVELMRSSDGALFWSVATHFAGEKFSG